MGGSGEVLIAFRIAAFSVRLSYCFYFSKTLNNLISDALFQWLFIIPFFSPHSWIKKQWFSLHEKGQFSLFLCSQIVFRNTF